MQRDPLEVPSKSISQEVHVMTLVRRSSPLSELVPLRQPTSIPSTNDPARAGA